MRQELIYTKKAGKWVGAIIPIDHSMWRSTDYTRLYAQFAQRLGLHPDSMSMDTLYPDQSRGLVYWSESLAIGGMRFTLIALPGALPAEMEKVRSEIKQNRDVVSMTKIVIDCLVPFTYTYENPPT